MPPDRPLLMLVERFLREHRIRPTTFGRQAARDPRFVFDLRRGRTPGARVRRTVEHFMNMMKESQQ
jgi:hypothetical protein